MIEWFGLPEELEISNKEIELIEKWIYENQSELHEIYHFLREHKMEGSKIIFGEQFENENGDIIIKSFEIYIIYDMVFIIKSEERQIFNTNDTIRMTKKLGIINLCTSEDECCR
ncbi:MAG: hypothetical protein QXI49_06545 [Candidatus Methanomethylicaceae archaeon]